MNWLKLAVPALLLAGCARAEPYPLEGLKISAAFALTDAAGHTVTERSFAGQYRIMYFGYTFCPDICPTTAQTIGAALRRLDQSDPTLSAKVTPVFVTVDPARDTPAVAGKFARAFHPRFVGLSGSPAATAAAAKAYGVYWAKGAAAPGGGYLVDHANHAYLMSPDNKPIALLPTDEGAQATADEIERWVR